MGKHICIVPDARARGRESGVSRAAGGCGVCSEAIDDGRCYVRVLGIECAVCRTCWEQVVLAPLRVMREWAPPASAALVNAI